MKYSAKILNILLKIQELFIFEAVNFQMAQTVRRVVRMRARMRTRKRKRREDKIQERKEIQEGMRMRESPVTRMMRWNASLVNIMAMSINPNISQA